MSIVYFTDRDLGKRFPEILTKKHICFYSGSLRRRRLRWEESLSETTEASDPLADAVELVGRFMYHFSRLEEQLNAAIAKLLGLNERTADIVTANVDFFRKVSIVHSAVNDQNASPDQQWLREEISKTFNRIASINNARQVIAHSPFEPAPNGGVQFKRSVARGELRREDPHWSLAKFEAAYEEMKALEDQLSNVLRHIKPYVPKLDFSDPRNSMYIGMLE